MLTQGPTHTARGQNSTLIVLYYVQVDVQFVFTKLRADVKLHLDGFVSYHGSNTNRITAIFINIPYRTNKEQKHRNDLISIQWVPHCLLFDSTIEICVLLLLKKL